MSFFQRVGGGLRMVRLIRPSVIAHRVMIGITRSCMVFMCLGNTVTCMISGTVYPSPSARTAEAYGAITLPVPVSVIHSSIHSMYTYYTIISLSLRSYPPSPLDWLNTEYKGNSWTWLSRDFCLSSLPSLPSSRSFPRASFVLSELALEGLGFFDPGLRRHSSMFLFDVMYDWASFSGWVDLLFLRWRWMTDSASHLGSDLSTYSLLCCLMLYLNRRAPRILQMERGRGKSNFFKRLISASSVLGSHKRVIPLNLVRASCFLCLLA